MGLNQSWPEAPSVSSLYADALGAFLAERGLPAAPPPTLAGHARRVVGASFAHTLYGGVRELGESALGLQFGTRVGGAGFGMLGVAAATAPTLAESIRHLTQLESLTSTLGHASVRRPGKLVHLSWRPAQAVPPMVVEGILAGWVSYGRYLLGEKVDVAQVSFAHPRLAAVHAYDSVLECPHRFGAPHYGVSFGLDLLDAKPRFAAPALNAALDGWLGHCAATVATRKSLARTIMGVLGTRVPLAMADEMSVAALLGLGYRTLQRQLRDEGTSFRQVLNATRAQHAVLSLLDGHASLSDLAAEVGFNEQSSLCRAFHRWTGDAPLDFRQRMAPIYHRLRVQ